RAPDGVALGRRARVAGPGDVLAAGGVVAEDRVHDVERAPLAAVALEAALDRVGEVVPGGHVGCPSADGHRSVRWAIERAAAGQVGKAGVDGKRRLAESV